MTCPICSTAHAVKTSKKKTVYRFECSSCGYMEEWRISHNTRTKEEKTDPFIQIPSSLGMLWP